MRYQRGKRTDSFSVEEQLEKLHNSTSDLEVEEGRKTKSKRKIDGEQTRIDG